MERYKSAFKVMTDYSNVSSSPSSVTSAAPTVISSIAPSIFTKNSTNSNVDAAVAQSVVLLIAVLVFVFLLISFLTITIFYCRKLMRLDEYGDTASVTLELELAAAAPTETVAYVRATSTDNLASAVITDTTTSSNYNESSSSNNYVNDHNNSRFIFFNGSRGLFGLSSSKVAITCDDDTQLPVAAEYHEIYNSEQIEIGVHNAYLTPVRVCFLLRQWDGLFFDRLPLIFAI